jgi:hypothetical protein
MHQTLVVCTSAKQKIHIYRSLYFTALAINSPLALFKLRRVPFQVIVNDVSAKSLQIDALLTD